MSTLLKGVMTKAAVAAMMLLGSTAFAAGPSNAVYSVTGPSGTSCEDLVAGQTIDAGDVCYSIDATGDNMTVTYNTQNGWELTEAHLWVGDSPTGYPMTNKGNPKIGNFPYNSGNVTGATTYSFVVPLSLWNAAFVCDANVTLYAMAHAAVRKDNGMGGYQTETGWSNGVRVVERGNWATQTTLTIHVTCQVEPPVESHADQTAFAVSVENGQYDTHQEFNKRGDVTRETHHFNSELSTCFLDIDADGDGAADDFSRWGWTNGPISAGTMVEMDLYAGAGQCDLDKGTLVGTLTVSYDGETAVVTYDAIDGYHFDQAHVYVGNDILATDNNGAYTVAPGQFTVVEEFAHEMDHVEYTFEGLSGDIHVVAHAVAGPFPVDTVDTNTP